MTQSLSAVSSIPHSQDTEPQVPQRGGEAAPSDVMLAVMKAHRNWALKYAPWLLEEWTNK